MTSRMNYTEITEFKKDFKKLIKHFKTLKEDLELVKKAAIELYHCHNIDNGSVFQMPGFIKEDIQIFKIKKIACKTLKGKGAKSGLRIIYAFHTKLSQVEFIEFYYKGIKENEDRDRIKAYLKSLST